MSQKISSSQLSEFCHAMAMTLHAGMYPAESIDILLDENTTDAEKKIYTKVRKKLKNDQVLSDAMEATGMFPSYAIQMCRLGEKTGSTDEVMERLSTYYQREADLRVSLHNAVFFPAMITLLMLAVIAVLLVFVIPVFDQVFQELGTNLNATASFFLKTGIFLRSSSSWIVCILLVLIVLVVYTFKTESGRKHLLNKMPFTKKRNENIDRLRFADTMSTIMKSGLMPEEGMAAAKDLCLSDSYPKIITACMNKMAEGASISQAMETSGVFTGIPQRMCRLAARTGDLDSTFDEIADYYQNEIDQLTNNRLSIIEPVCVVTLSLIIGLILLSVMFPLLGILTSL